MRRENQLDSDMPFVFLLCSERSGSNLITKLFDSHPQFCGPSPSHIIRTFSRNIWRYGDITRDENWQVLCADTADFLQNQLGKWRTHWTTDRLLQEVRQRSVATLIRHVYEEEALTCGKTRVFVKENQTYRLISFLLGAFPSAKFVYMVRDPRDMSLSLKRSQATPGRVYRAGQLWKNDQEQSIEIYGILKDMGTIILLRYEDLIVDPDRELRRICGFLETEYCSSMLEFYSNDLTVENAQRINAWRNLRQPVLSTNYKKYAAALNELEIRYIEALCKNEMQYLGYPLDFPQTAELNCLEKQLIDFENQLAPETNEILSDQEKKNRVSRLTVIDKIIRRNLWINSKNF